MLDEMDGKQARRTGNSSALGMIFDHGCDAFSIGLFCLLCAKFMQMGDNVWTLIFVNLTTLSFHMSTLEEYYTGGLFLGKLNAVTDGSLPLILLFIFLGCFGNEWPVTDILSKDYLFEGQPAITYVEAVIVYIYVINIGTSALW